MKFHSLSLAACAALLALTCVNAAHAGELADPTRPAGAKSVHRAGAPRPAPVVSAILVANGRRVAVVDGQAVRAGDVLGDTRIDAILENGVRYTRAGVSGLSELPAIAARVRDPSGPPVRLGDSKP